MRGARQEWDAYDLETPDGIKIEVKSAAYLQSWFQKTFSEISSRIRKARGWDARTNTLAQTARRHADVYVFCLLAHKDQASVDPLDVAQWEFYVVPTVVLDRQCDDRQSISLKPLRGLCEPMTYPQVAAAVREAAALE